MQHRRSLETTTREATDMPRTATQGFDIFLARLTPSDANRAKASLHRASIESKLESRFGVYRMFETGSFRHGTGVAGYSDVDFLVSLKSSRPQHSSSTLTAVKDALVERFPLTYITVSRPAVVLHFGGGYERVEVVPGFYASSEDSGIKYKIPGFHEEWMESTPQAHLQYVDSCNQQQGVKGGAKSLARLLKAWKYYRNVPVSSFYLEMRAAQYMATQSSISWPHDLAYVLRRLNEHSLASMNDPTGETGRIHACSSSATYTDARSKLSTASTRADRALEHYSAGRISSAFDDWDLLFNGKFPSYYL
jgi:hypothetical protein